jgi:uncharacterized membrane protein
MIQRIKSIWQDVRDSLWALPVGMLCGAALLAVLALRYRVGQGDDPVWWLYSGDAKDTPQFLSNLVSAMITMATLAISITMVVLALAAQQLGPRLIRNFMADKKTQASLGLFVSTVVYLLLVLRSTYGAGDTAPNLAVTLGTFLVLTSVVVSVLFVHHLARSIIADNVISKVGAELDAAIERLLPERGDTSKPKHNVVLEKDGAPLRLSRGGYVQAIDFGRLEKCACEAEATIRLDIRAGHHVIPGAAVGWVSPSSGDKPPLHEQVRSAIMIGGERTPDQDIEFSIRQLVEIGVRALSPGINDPYTAVAAMDRLTISIAKVMTRGPAKDTWEDKEGRIRVVAPVSTFEGIVDVAFNQIRQSGERVPAVLIRLTENLRQLHECADADQRPILQKHLRQVLEAGDRTIGDETDRAALRQYAGS